MLSRTHAVSRVVALGIFTTCAADPLDDLVASMSVPEKARQLVIRDLVATFVTNGEFDRDKAQAYLGGLGVGVLDSAGRNVDPVLLNDIQRAVFNSSRHGISAIFAEECQHGVEGDWHTVFPSPYTWAATFDRGLMAKVGEVIGAEARAHGVSQCWAPVCGLAREPRWGRSEEEMGEDPFLAGELAAAVVSGMVGATRSPPATLSSEVTVAPLLKHFAAYSVPEAGHNLAPAHMGRRELQTVFLPVFAKAIKAGAQGAMSSYNEIDGMPASKDRWLLTDQLRDELGFQGYVMSDFGAIQFLLADFHAVAANSSEAVRVYLEAGGAVNGHDFGDDYEKIVVDLVESRRMAESTLDRAVKDVLAVKTRLGLVGASTPVVDESLVSRNLGNNPEHAHLALQVAREGVVLLSNSDGLIPVDSTAIHSVVVLGPNQDEARSGDYSAAGADGGQTGGGGNINNNNTVTILEGIKRVFPTASVESVIGVGVSKGPPYYTVVQRHSFATDQAFTPTTLPSPYAPACAAPLAEVPAGTQGLQSEYFAGTRLGESADAAFTRLDYAPSFHWFALGPHPRLLRSGTFSVRWTGQLTPDATVDGAINVMLCMANSCGTPTGMGARLFLDEQLVIDAWADDGARSTSAPSSFRRGKTIKVKLEYWQKSSDGLPSVALQWSLVPNSAAEAMAVAQASARVASGGYDLAVLCLGGANNDGEQTTEGENSDRASLGLPGGQLALLKAVVKSATSAKVPLAVVLADGKPTAEPFLKTLPTVLAAFQGGQASGQAVAEILAGLTMPSGRLPVTFPISSDVLPVFYNRHPSAQRVAYCDVQDPVLWPFGYGLSTTNFNFSALQLPSAPVLPDGIVEAEVTVTNTGPREGTAVALLFVRDVLASVVTPVRQLKGFERAILVPGESIKLKFTIDVASELRVLGSDYKWAVEPGDFQVWVQGSSDGKELAGMFQVGSADGAHASSVQLQV